MEDVDDEGQEQIRGEIPLGRFATVQDVSGLVTSLASESAAYITGEVIEVNGEMDL